MVICVDGFDPEYLQHGIADGILPHLEVMTRTGTSVIAYAAMPTFTNPNNCCIITGAATNAHGIAGNFYLDRETGKERLIMDDSLLQGSTILEQLSRRGLRVAAVTAKDKLRRIIQHGLQPGQNDICFSSEFSDRCTAEDNGIDNVEAYVGRAAPPQYSGDLSLFVLDAGIKLLEDDRADVFYLTLSDYIQHKHAPGTKEANDFMWSLDDKIGRLVELGANVVITGDHGMSDKSLPDGSPNVLYVEEELESRFGKGKVRVVCPITDPYVRHHGALGSFVRVYLNESIQIDAPAITKHLESLPQTYEVLSGAEAALKYQTPIEVEGDLVVIAEKHAVLGSRKDNHDLSNLQGHRLRSHGGLSEQKVPLMSNMAMTEALKAQKGSSSQWRNFDAFHLLLNSI